MVLDRGDLQKLHRYAYSLTANEADAYDLLQSAIETSLSRPAGSVDKTISYIRMIMKNRFIDDYRHRQSFVHEDIDDHSPVSMNESSLEDVVIASHDLTVLWKTLEPVDREVLFYWAVEGFSMREIAD
ncbi:MAG: RNA polymerase sigma factor, partial [Gammaproteobacteria bacterium]|nr:RNA polymerase sigma factor [Gammaproteobacteria bacterium]